MSKGVEDYAWMLLEKAVLPAIPDLGKLLAGALERPASAGNPIARKVLAMLPEISESEEAAEEIRQAAGEGDS